MNKRPVTITVIAWIMIIGNGIALVERLSGGILLTRASELIQSSSPRAIPTSMHDFQLYAGWVISIVSWIFILRGANWARYLFIIWGAIDFVASFIVGASSFALFYPIAVIFLLRPKVQAYFMADREGIEMQIDAVDKNKD